MVAEMLKQFEEAWKKSLNGVYSRENDALIRNLAIKISNTTIPQFLRSRFLTTVKHANSYAAYAKNL